MGQPTVCPRMARRPPLVTAARGERGARLRSTNRRDKPLLRSSLTESECFVMLGQVMLDQSDHARRRTLGAAGVAAIPHGYRPLMGRLHRRPGDAY